MKGLKKQVKGDRPKKEKLTPKEALKRMNSFQERREKFIAAVREGTHRDINL